MATELNLPRYTTILPLSKEEISYRPFTVKEEKVLLMANEGNQIKDVTDAVEQLVNICTDGKVTATSHSMFDVQHMFLQLRSKSISEVLDLTLTCQKEVLVEIGGETATEICEHRTAMSVRLDEFAFRKTEGHSNTIDLGNCRIIMRYPTFKDYGLLYETNDADDVYNVVASCIEKIVMNDEVRVYSTDTAKEFREFVDNITPMQFKKLEAFFNTMPVLEYTATYTCEKCKNVNVLTLDGVRNFFQ